LTCIKRMTFRWCDSLDSIILPSTVTTLEASCFESCSKLVSSPLPIDSNLIRIEWAAFRECWSLKSMFLPSSVEFVGIWCFVNCDSLSSLTFGSPSHLRELLHLPSFLRGPLSIPDSVEILRFGGTQNIPVYGRTLIFGPESKLAKMKQDAYLDDRYMVSFLQVSTRSLKVFRVKLEFDGEKNESDSD
jgi:hypothetical protein